jgi:hypothetical protein
MFKNNGINTYDYVDYRGKVVITRNPFGFINEPEIKIGGSTTDADADADPKTKTKSEKRINVKQNATGLPRFGRQYRHAIEELDNLTYRKTTKRKGTKRTTRRKKTAVDNESEPEDTLNRWENGATRPESATPHSDAVVVSGKEERELDQYNRNPTKAITDRIAAGVMSGRRTKELQRRFAG